MEAAIRIELMNKGFAVSKGQFGCFRLSLYLIDSVCFIGLTSFVGFACFAPFWLRCHSIVTQTHCFQVLLWH
jgi:hypothetical protein